MRGALDTTDNLQQTEQGLRFTFERGFESDRCFEFFEERLDAEHHYAESHVPLVNALAPLLVPAFLMARKAG